MTARFNRAVCVFTKDLQKKCASLGPKKRVKKEGVFHNLTLKEKHA